MINADTIEIDRDEKQITIVNNRQLHKAIASGAAGAAALEILSWLSAAAESIDATLGAAIEALTRLVGITFLHLAYGWELTNCMSVSMHASGSATLNVTATREQAAE